MTMAQAQEIRRIQEQRALAGSHGYMPTPPPIDPQVLARQMGFQNGRQAGHSTQFYPSGPTGFPTMAGSNHTYYPHTRPSQHNGYTAGRAYSPPSLPPHLQHTNGYQLNARDIQAMARASPVKSQQNMGRGITKASALQPTEAMYLDPRLFSSSTSGSMPSSMPSKMTKPVPSPHLPTSMAHPLSVPNPPQYAGAKRPAPSGKDAYAEGPVPKKGMFPTAPPSRPNSAHGSIAPMQQKKPSQTRNDKDGRLHKEAVLRGVHSLGMLKQKFSMQAQADEFEQAGHATAATPGYTKQMMDIKNNAIALEKESEKQKARRTKQAGRAKPSMGPPSRPASAAAQTKKPTVIDLTGPDPLPRPPTSQRRENRQIGGHRTAATRPPSKPAGPIAQDLHHHALKQGVHMSDVECGSHIQSGMAGWLMHQQDVALARSMLDPSPANLQRLRRANAASTHASTNTMDAAHAEALKLPRDFNMAAVQKKVRHRSYDYGFSQRKSHTLTAARQEALKTCERDADGGLRAPEEQDVSEERANVGYELLHAVAAAKSGAKLPRKSSSGEASWW